MRSVMQSQMAVIFGQPAIQSYVSRMKTADLSFTEFCLIDDMCDVIAKCYREGVVTVQFTYWNGIPINHIDDIDKVPVMVFERHGSKGFITSVTIEGKLVTEDGQEFEFGGVGYEGPLKNFVKARLVHLAMRKTFDVAIGSDEDILFRLTAEAYRQHQREQRATDFIQINISGNRVSARLEGGVYVQLYKNKDFILGEQLEGGIRVQSTLKGVTKEGKVALSKRGSVDLTFDLIVDHAPFVASVEARIRQRIREFTESDNDFGYSLTLLDESR